MSLKNSSHRYGSVAKVLHWVVALAVIGLFGLGLYMTSLGYYDPWYHTAPDLHRGFGVVVALLLLFRLVWRQFNPRPQPEPNHKAWEVKAAEWVHRALYLLLFGIVISGYLISTADGRAIEVFGVVAIPSLTGSVANLEDYAGTLHLGLAIALMTLVGLHALAALKHHFVDRDRTLLRMLPMPTARPDPLLSSVNELKESTNET